MQTGSLQESGIFQDVSLVSKDAILCASVQAELALFIWEQETKMALFVWEQKIKQILESGGHINA